MKRSEFISSFGDLLTISEKKLSVTNKFGDTYTGYLDEKGKPVAKSVIGLGYISRAYNEFTSK